MKKTIAIAAAALLICMGCSAGTPKKDSNNHGMDLSRIEKADSTILKAIEDGIMPGAVFAVVRGDDIVYLKAYGDKQVVPTRVPMTTDTMFDLASLSKCVGTTLSFMTLFDDGKVNLIDDVKRYIPGFAPYVSPEGRKQDILVRDLMTHTSGLPAYVDVNYCVKRFGEHQPDSLINYIAKELPRRFKPGTDITYSCLNFVTLQNILQNVTGQRLCDYAQKHVFDVLGLKHTCYLPLDREIPADILPLIAPTEVQADGLPLVGQVHDPIARRLNSGNSGNAGVFSSAEDLAVIASCIMNGGVYKGRRILSPAAVRLMATVPEENDPAIGRALGWDADTGGTTGCLMGPDHVIFHTGYTGTSMVIDLDTKTAVILLTNRVHPKDTGNLYHTRSSIANIVASAVLE